MNISGKSPLGEAVYCGKVDVIRCFIIDHKVSVNGEFTHIIIYLLLS